VSGAGDSTIQGFGSDQSVNAGQTIQFKINSTANSYHIDILRFGWYGGNGARKVQGNIRPTVPLPQSQPACQVDTSNTTGLVDCGNWAVSAQWTVPSTAVSGVYAAHLVRDDNGGDSLIEFVVRNDSSHAAVVYQTADATREAYNQYGGNSMYVCTVACPPGNPLVYKAAYKISFNRPNTAASIGGEYSFFGAEFQMVEFLEANGYDVSYISGVDTDRAGSLLKNHQLFISSGHDEYWSGNQRSNVEAALGAGVNLAFFSGNEVFWKTRYENSVAGTSTAYRTLVCYKESHFLSPVDPQDPPTWTGAWADPTFSPPADGGRPGNGLTGTLFSADAPGATSAIQVPSTFSRLRFWRNTGVAQLAAGQTATLGDSTLGYEWDSDVDNGFRPAGNIDLSSTTLITPHHLIDYSNTEVSGSATHSLTLHKAPSGALVFGAGTVQWSWGLEGSPDGKTGPNLNQEQATINLFADMGIQPATLIAGLVTASKSTDMIAPTSTITSPASGTVIADGATVTVSGTASDMGGGVVAGVEVSTDGGTTWHPATGTTQWSYTWNVATMGAVTIKVRATDDSGNIGTPGAGTPVTVNCPCQIFPNAATPATPDSGDGSSVEVGVKFQATTDGFITGIRFYKAATNTGTHVGELWTSGGQLLASATFTAESASGWQTVAFPQGVHVTPNTTYIASYFTSAGHYSADAKAFAGGAITSPPLVATKSISSDPNGVFASTRKAGAFPNQTFNATNYWTDVLFISSTGQPALIGESPLPNSTNQTTVNPVTATFNKDVVASTITFTVATSSNAPVGGSVAYSSSSKTATFTPSAPLSPGTTYKASLSGAQDIQGAMMAPASWSFTTFTCPCTLWSPPTVPGQTDAGDNNHSVELGVRYSSDVNAYVSGVRFYKAVTNTGAHVGSLWNSNGTLLAQGTFQNETASGWQQLDFANPVPISAGASYVMSYHTNTGHYSADAGYFVTGVTNGPLHAPADNPPSGPSNGVYTYAASATFPSSAFQSTNYWVDVVVTTTPPGSMTPTVTSQVPAPGATNASPTGPISATFNEAVQASTISFGLVDANKQAVPGTTNYDVPSKTATFVPSSSLISGVGYTATISGAQDLYGNAMTGPVSWSFTTTTPTCPCTLWSASTLPTIASASDTKSIELGVRFKADRSGYITGVRFYKGSANTGTHVGNLWSTTGTLLATGVFANETATGWQQLDFTNAVPVSAGTVYVASYHANSGGYASSSNYFTTALDNSPLHAPADGLSSANGVYSYSANAAFPTSSFQSTNYWVDPVFNTSGTPRTTPPVVTSNTPTSGATGVPQFPLISAQFDEAINPATLVLSLATSGNQAVAGSTSYDSQTRTATFSPSAALAPLATYTASVQATDLAGNAMTAPTKWSFTTVAASCPCTIWPSSTVPGTVDSGDTSNLELGVRFRASVNGNVTGARFYKAAANTGIHTASLWTNSGQLLATATFINETASGWQSVTFASPVAVTSGTTYVLSYHAPSGHYSVNEGYFAGSGASSGTLQALADGVDGANGVYVVGAPAFPTQTFRSSNYWVDPIFSTS
jgi:hypothetical protein